MDFKKRVLIKLEEMHSFLNELEELIPERKSDYLHNLTIRRASEKTIELAIETVISIISMLVSHQKLGVPQSEENLIEILKKNKIISSKVADQIKQMKGFRNILIHKYGEVNDKLVYQYLIEELNDFDSFEKEILKYIKNN